MNFATSNENILLQITNDFQWIPIVVGASKQTESKTSNEQIPEQVMGGFHNL